MPNKILIEVVGDSRSFNKALDSASKKSKGFGLASKAAFGVAGAAVTGLGIAAKVGWDEFNEGQKVAAQTNAVIKSTGGVANVTAKQVDELATSLMKKSGVDDEAIKSGENILLTFKGIRNEAGKGNKIFDQTTRAALDMSVALGTDTTSSAMQLGKALNDPAEGLAKLQRVGVTFTEAQEKQITKMTEAGNVMGAQKVILKELRSEFGGSAKAAGDTFAGQINIAKESVSNWLGEMVGRAIPILQDFAKRVMPFVKRALAFIGEVINDVVLPGLRNFRDVIKQNMPEIKEAFLGIKEAWELIWKVVKPILRLLFTEVLPRYLGVAIKVIGLYVKAVGKIIDGARRLVDWFRGTFAQFWKDAWFGFRDLFFDVRDAILRNFLTFAGRFVDIADKAFGWVPFLDDKFDKAKDGINRALDKMEIGKRKRDVDAFARSVDSIKSKDITIDVDANVRIAGTEITAGMLTARKAAAGGIFKATPGGALHMVEAGHDEAVVSLDPRHKKRSMQIMSEVVKRLYGKRDILPGFAEGGIATASAALRRTNRRIPKIAEAIAWLAAQGGVPAQRALIEAQRMTSLRRPYLWGGGHAGYDSDGPWDCSGAVSQVLHKAGVWPGPPAVVSGFTGWGKSGPGPLEVHLDPGVHMFMSALGKTFGTSGENPGGGFGGPLSYHYRSGFQTRSMDRGGWLPPRSATLAVNGTSQWERVGPPGQNGGGGYPGGPVMVMTDRATARWLQDLNRRHSRGNGGKDLW